MKYVTFWYQFFTRCEELVPIFHSVKFAVQQSLEEMQWIAWFTSAKLRVVTVLNPQREKNCLRGFANNKGTDQPVCPSSLISTILIRLLESIISIRRRLTGGGGGMGLLGDVLTCAPDGLVNVYIGNTLSRLSFQNPLMLKIKQSYLHHFSAYLGFFF